ncbi:MAG: cation transporting ATPase C-terminal domain-containing protein, partial [Gammaproteobacteria bacterium]
LSAALVPVAGYPLLFLPIHIVWLELIIHPTALLVVQELPGDRRLAGRRAGGKLRFFSTAEWVTISAVGALITILLVLGYDRSLGIGRDVEHARAMVIAALSVASGAITAVLSRLRTATAWIVVVVTLGLSALLIQLPFLAARLHVAPLHLDDWLVAALGGCAVGVLPALSSLTGRERHH